MAKTIVTKLELEKTKVNAEIDGTLPHPVLHHPISDILLQQADPFGSTTDKSAFRIGAYVQAMTHMGLIYIKGMTPELVTASMGENDVRNGQWFPAYRATTAAATDAAYLYARDILLNNKYLRASADRKLLTPIDRSDTAVSAFITAANSLTALPAGSTKTSVADADKKDRVVVIKDKDGNIFFCPLITPGVNWNSTIIRPEVFGGHGDLVLSGESADLKYIEAPVLAPTFLKLDDGCIKDGAIDPKLPLGALAAALTADSDTDAMCAALFEMLAPVLPPIGSGTSTSGAPVAKVYAHVRAVAAVTRELELGHVLVDPTATDLVDLTDKISTSGVPNSTNEPGNSFLSSVFFAGTLPGAYTSGLTVTDNLTVSPIYIGKASA